MKVLTLTTLYPNAVIPNHGVFVENRIRHLVKEAQVETRVVAPVPWFPSRNRRFGRYAQYAAVPVQEERGGIQITHPRYPVLPKIGMSLAPWLLARAVLNHLRGPMWAGYDFDLIDSHYLYPDGVAAALVGRTLGKPVVITVRGSDVNVLPRYTLPRRWIQWATREAGALISVSQALKASLARIGTPGNKITVLRNGVNLTDFQPPANRHALRQRLGIKAPLILTVGRLVPLKGHDVIIRALRALPEVQLMLAGDGPQRDALARLAQKEGVAGRVTFLGNVPHAQLVAYYGAADVLLLASEHEGWPNVLLEAMACGTPVVATRVGGTPEIVTTREAGLLIDARTPGTIAAAAGRLIESPPDRNKTRAFAEQFSWFDVSRGQRDVFQQVLGRHGT